MRIALVSPVFHGYWKSIQHGLEQCGHEVVPVIYDARSGLVGKLSAKLRYDIPRRFGSDPVDAEMAAASNRVSCQVQNIRPDLLLVVKGDTLDPGFIGSVRADGTTTALWLYDELSRMHHTVEGLEGYDLVASYSPSDTQRLVAQGVAAIHLPNAFDERLTPTRDTNKRTADVVLVGARYSNRERSLKEISRAGLEVRAYGRDWSHHLVDRGRSLSWYRPNLPAGRDLPRELAATAMAQATAVLNRHGVGHEGFTMVTFEAAGVGGLELIDRPDVEALYEPGREVIVFQEAQEAIEAVERAKRDSVWADAIRDSARRRTLAQHTYRHRCAQLLADLC